MSKNRPEGDGATRHWIKHTIDESYSQIHALKLVDIDGDGQPELLAGKRYRGHSGNDPGSYDPLVVYYYKIDRKTGDIHALSHQREWHCRRGNAVCGARTWTATAIIDIVTAGKTGVHFFENLTIDRVPKAEREKEILLDTNWPFQDEGPQVPQDEEPKKQ